MTQIIHIVDIPVQRALFKSDNKADLEHQLSYHTRLRCNIEPVKEL